MKAVYKKRLLRLAEHLETGTLGHKKFDFRVFNETPETFKNLMMDYNNAAGFDRRGCGSMGCALGELPIVFPKQWMFDKNTYGIEPILKNRACGGGDSFYDAEEFFGITREESCFLFSPMDDTAPWNRKRLNGKSTRKQVAASIRRFVAWKQAQPEEASAAL